MAVLHRKMIVQLVAVLFLAAGLGKAEVTLEKSAYHNLLVSLPPNLEIDDGTVLLDSLIDLLENTSRVLHSTLDIRIGDVTFLLPDSWDVSGWEDPSPTLGSASREDSDIVVESVQDNPFGKNPLAMQFGGCGVRGSRITVPTEFLTATEVYPKGKLLAREWLKYRYGVFDENGFPGDPLYPSHYTIPGNDEEVQVTECTDPQVEYTFKDSNGNNCSLIKDSVDTCKIHPGEMSVENVTSSLMFFHEELPNVDHVCGKEYLHNNLSPSKQNILCGEKSIWEVLEESPDFKILPASGLEYASPEYHFAKERKPKVAVLFENTIHLANKKDELIFALQRLVYDLPVGSHLSLYSFMNNKFTAELRPLSELTDRSNVVQTSDFDAPVTDVCPLCALSVAVDGFPSDDKHGSIILIVGSNSTKQDNNDLVAKLKTSQLCVTVIALRDAEATVDGYSDFLSQIDCQVLVEIPNSEQKMATFDALYQYMFTSVPSTYTESSKEVVTSGVMSHESAIQIQANPRAAKFTIWLGRPILENNIICKKDNVEVSISKSDPQSTIYTFDPIDKDVTCNLQNENSFPVLTQVQMTIQDGHFFAESVWIHDPTPAGSKEQMPVIIYAKVNYGDYPVSNARVKATVMNSEGQVGDSFELYDNGKGDPDVTKDDGIYSRYFFQFSKADDYYVSVEANDNGGMARALKNGEDRCCGSQVKTQKQDPVPTFTRTSETRFLAVSAKPEDGYPPSKIIDLRVGQYKPPTLLELKWTAPGGEVDTGKASVYEFKLFCYSETDCRENGSLPAWISLNDSNPEPKEAGQDETVKLLLSDEAPTNATVLIGVEAVRLNQTSGLSNRVQVRLTGVEIPDPTPTAPVVKEDDPDSVSVGTIVGATVVGVLVLFCITALICFFVSRARRQWDEKTEMEVDATERSGSFKASSFRSGKQHPMRRVESFPVILYTHDQIKDVKSKTKVKEPPLFRADVVAKPWMSLGELPSGRDEQSSDGSGSTIRVNGRKEEMKQLNGDTMGSEVRQTVDKEAKF